MQQASDFIATYWQTHNVQESFIYRKQNEHIYGTLLPPWYSDLYSVSNKSSSYINDIPIVSGGMKLIEAILFMFIVITLAGQYQMPGNHEVTLQHTKKP